jgi:hypothetical protein
MRLKKTAKTRICMIAFDAVRTILLDFDIPHSTSLSIHRMKCRYGVRIEPSDCMIAKM